MQDVQAGQLLQRSKQTTSWIGNLGVENWRRETAGPRRLKMRRIELRAGREYARIDHGPLKGKFEGLHSYSGRGYAKQRRYLLVLGMDKSRYHGLIQMIQLKG